MADERKELKFQGKEVIVREPVMCKLSNLGHCLINWNKNFNNTLQKGIFVNNKVTGNKNAPSCSSKLP